MPSWVDGCTSVKLQGRASDDERRVLCPRDGAVHSQEQAPPGGENDAVNLVGFAAVSKGIGVQVVIASGNGALAPAAIAADPKRVQGSRPGGLGVVKLLPLVEVWCGRFQTGTR